MKGGEIMKKIILLLVLITAIALAVDWEEQDNWFYNGTEWVQQKETSTARGRKWMRDSLAGVEDTTNIAPCAEALVFR